MSAREPAVLSEILGERESRQDKSSTTEMESSHDKSSTTEMESSGDKSSTNEMESGLVKSPTTAVFRYGQELKRMGVCIVY